MDLTNLNIGAVLGKAALLPNQPIIHNCIVADDGLKVGDIVALTESNNKEVITVKKAVDEIPFGVVAFGCIKTGYVSKERVSVYPVGSFVYMVASDDTIQKGDKVAFDTDHKMIKAQNSGDIVLGYAVTSPAVENDLIIVQIQPGILAEHTYTLGDNIELTDTQLYGWSGEIPGHETLYTLADDVTGAAILVYAKSNNIFEKFVDDGSREDTDSPLVITLAGKEYEYTLNSDLDVQTQFLNVVIPEEIPEE